jgi:hypothetical protein
MDVMARRRVVTELTYQILAVDFVGLAVGSVTRDFGGCGGGGCFLFLAGGVEFVELLMSLGEAAPDGGAIAFELEGGVDEVAVLAFDFGLQVELGAVEVPAGLVDGFDEVLAGGIPRLEFEEEPRERVFVDALIFAGEDFEVADVLGEAVFEGVLAGAVLAFLSLRSCFRGRVARREGVFVGAAAFDGARRIAFGEDFVAGLALGTGLAWGFGFGFLFRHGRLLSCLRIAAGVSGGARKWRATERKERVK